MIRLMRVEDIPGICEIERKTGVCVWGASGYKEALENDYICLVYEENGTVKGFAITRVLSEEAEILNLAVSPEWMGCRIGSKLLEACKEFAKAKGVRKVWLEVRSSNLKAKSFYERRGFSVVFRRKNFYQNPLEDGLVMRHEIQ